MKKSQRKVLALGMAIATAIGSLGVTLPAPESQAATVKYIKGGKSVTFSDSKGIKTFTVNGKKKKIKAGSKKVKYTFGKSEGKYVIKYVTKKKKTITRTYIVDKTAPIISGVADGDTYNNEVTIKVKDNKKLKSLKVNNKAVKSPYTVNQEGLYDVVATDYAGNKKQVVFSIENLVSATPEATTGAAVKESATPTGTAITSTPTSQTNTPTSQTSVPTLQTSTPASVCVHTWDKGEIIQQPTCTSLGIRKLTCTKCKETKIELINKLSEHEWDEGVLTEATCTAAATKTYTCKHCGATKVETVGEQLGHDYKKEYTISEATAIADRVYGHKCTRCSEKKDEQITEPYSHIDRTGPAIACAIGYPRGLNDTTSEYTPFVSNASGYIHKDLTVNGPVSPLHGLNTIRFFVSDTGSCVKRILVFDNPVIYNRDEGFAIIEDYKKNGLKEHYEQKVFEWNGPETYEEALNKGPVGKYIGEYEVTVDLRDTKSFVVVAEDYAGNVTAVVTQNVSAKSW